MEDAFPKAAFETIAQAASTVGKPFPPTILGIDTLWLDLDALSRAAAIYERTVADAFKAADSSLKTAMSQASAHWSGTAATAFNTWTAGLSTGVGHVVADPLPKVARTLRDFEKDLKAARKKMAMAIHRAFRDVVKAFKAKSPTAILAGVVDAFLDEIETNLRVLDKSSKEYAATVKAQNSAVAQIKTSVDDKAVQVPAGVGDPGQWTAK